MRENSCKITKSYLWVLRILHWFAKKLCLCLLLKNFFITFAAKFYLS